MAESISDKTFEDVLQLIMDRSNAKVRTMMPAKVLSFNADKGTATVRPVIHSFYYNHDTGEPQPYLPQPIPNCPVTYQTGGGYEMTYPLEAGDQVYIGVAERSIDEWAATGQEALVPQDLRRFDLTDAVVLAGIIAPNVRTDAIPTDGAEIRHAGSGFKVRVTENGLYLGDGTNELIALVRDLLGHVDDLAGQVSTLAASVTTTMLGPQPLSNGPAVATQVGTIQTALGTTDTKLDSIKE